MYTADVYIANEYKAGLTGQDLVLDAAAEEIFAELNKKLEETTDIHNSRRRASPNAQELIAKSHLIAGTLFHHKFEGRFSGVFGDFKGTLIIEPPGKEENENITSCTL
ncbi:hypothetical protein LEAN103870_08940 [Legionella anisa]|uniref:Uncharacterized protein n=1 Tax=Legionella anisa TaxID=28082 RepID=A0AAX0WXB1_9GAMM|nr:hypothetical protein [Legionella anisa]AWN72862.1 hypothetical protein DLD14_02845 [Legionella anisa]KTC70689.1 uridine kinase [Legionella anisa]MBN5934658.1 hypothetical protein [Legionella anisa]MCW8423667.1 hypothetical protein [Legionella anisa]MCW8447187.1 hypothetical protein [Legionella anisa]